MMTKKRKRRNIDGEFKYAKHPMNAAYKRFPDGISHLTVLDMIKPIPRTPGTMKLNEYQKQAEEFIAFPDAWTIAYPALGLASEAGEVCDKIKKAIRDRKSLKFAELPDIVKPELGDVLWYIATLCTNLGLELEEVAEYNIGKLKSRKARDTIGGSGDLR